ncbi:hypothetical protein BH11PSE2_BH11PSE2_11460 [soil metagenome]
MLVLIAGPVHPQEAPAPVRCEVAVQEVVLSDGVRRYGIPVTIGDTEVLAGIDTGAAGLRLMPDVVAIGQVKAGAVAETYSFGSGAHLTGVVGQARVRIGALGGTAAVHLVQNVDCIARAPGCPGRLGLGYGFLGDGLPKEGFRVLLGANMGLSTVDNPLRAVGARQWILEVPRPGEAAPGRLILNPTAAEMAGYVSLRLAGGHAERDGGGLHDSVPGCLRHEETGRKVCGLMTLDTGAFSIRVLNAPANAPRFAAGAPVALEFWDEDRKTAATAHVVLGRPAQGIYYGSAPRPETIIQLGAAPYYAYSVLYDPVRRRLGFKARPPVEGLPRAD